MIAGLADQKSKNRSMIRRQKMSYFYYQSQKIYYSEAGSGNHLQVPEIEE